MVHYQWIGDTQSNKPILLLSSGLGGAGNYWREQFTTLKQSHTLLLYDHLGTNQSEASLPAAYRIEDMAAELAELLDDLAISRIDFMGHALGALIGFELALMRPNLINNFVAVNAWATLSAHTERCFQIRQQILQDSGIEAYVASQSLFLYSGHWLGDNHQHVLAEIEHALKHFQGEENLTKRIGALTQFKLNPAIRDCAFQLLIIATRDDLLVPYQQSEALVEYFKAAQLQLMPYGGHAVNVTQVGDFNQRVGEFFKANIVS